MGLSQSAWSSNKTVGIVAVGVVAALAYFAEQHPGARSLKCMNALRKPGFSFEQIPDMTGKVIIITGGSAGLGNASTSLLYRKNAHVIMAVRSIQRGEEAKDRILASAPSSSKGKITVMKLELDSLKSVRDFATEFVKLQLPLHVLMLNAGIFGSPFELTKDGIESTFGVNHVSHHYLTKLLLPLLQTSAPSRVVSLSSGEHRNAPSHGVGLSLAQINDPSSYDPYTAYGQSKLANILFARELAQRVRGTGVYVNVVHPGLAKTQGDQHGAWQQRAHVGFLGQVAAFSGVRFGGGCTHPVVLGCFAGGGGEGIHGQYYVPLAVPMPVYAHPGALDAELQRGVWEFTEELIERASKSW